MKGSATEIYCETYKKTVRDEKLPPTRKVILYIQGGALNRGLFFADPPPSLLGAVSEKISEIREAAA